ncbi:MAG TPA: GNAT family N-acetyltransferase [Candidatus Krumholzibacteria bacterium]|nr:GNAT family N-acetyltransferase [Candidatus Krumholzibacteria bacterium]HPD71642.1 GNAT family N-acetyltransferase [Candidatus Krumholzibacteria bacterium]HRY41425.1 GNAT family N-acetyltransferase [Candidatus Krumholzibacteria bacterium]
MSIRTVRLDEYEGFLAFLNAGMRPEPTATRAEDDFPVILGRGNLDGLWGWPDARGWAAGLAVLTRRFTSSAGDLTVAGIGSVVTRADRRGEGLSAGLQEHVVARLSGAGVALGVLWSDRPAIYAGRGFQPAGWEYHLDLAGLEPSGLLPDGAEIRSYRPADAGAVANLYGRHPLRTIRQPGDDAVLYAMPGTRGFVLDRGGNVLAYAFCGKGADFPGYVTEWGGPAPDALAVLAEVRARGLATRALVPAGREDLLDLAVSLGAGLAAVPSGLWSILRPDLLPGGDAGPADGQRLDPRAWLGTVDEAGMPVPGRLRLAVWGFDSV